MSDTLIIDKAQRIRDVIRYIRRFKNASVIIHIDDSLIDSPLFTSHIRDICLIHEAGLRVLIVPGAKKRIDEVLKSSGCSWKTENGFRITESDAMPLIKMAAFDVSNRIMTALAAEKRTAVIGNWVRARAKGVIDGIDYGTCGEIDKIQMESLDTILQNGFIPIFPCIGWSSVGKPYNISSVSLAAETAVRMKADKLFFLTQDESISKNEYVIPQGLPLSPEGCIPALNLEELVLFLQENKLSDKKDVLSLLNTALLCCKKGVSRVHILNGSIDGTIPCEIFSDLGSGTMIYENNYGGIRPMTQEDVPSVLSLMMPFVEKGILLPRTETELKEGYADYIVYELDGGIRACAALHVYDGEQAEIAGVAVDENCAHMGIGPKMLSYLTERAKEKKLTSLFVLTTQTSDWFETQGFLLSDISTLPDKRKAKWTNKRGSKILRLSI